MKSDGAPVFYTSISSLAPHFKGRNLEFQDMHEKIWIVCG